MIILGLDIGSNSVGSAWINTKNKTVRLAVGIFPAGVDETDQKRGSPVNQKRREKRAQRRSIARRAKRKHALRRLLLELNWLPTNQNELDLLLESNPWRLRREGLSRELSPHEFGRILMHLNQRRGALGVETDPEDEEEGKVKEAIDHVRREIVERYAMPNVKEPLVNDVNHFVEWARQEQVTFGRFIADLMDDRRHTPRDANGQVKEGKFFHDPVRNRRDQFEFHADRTLIREEFNQLWTKQRSFGGRLALMLSDDLKKRFDNEEESNTWRHQGVLFGQRRTYWDTGTLGRCELEPTDHRCSLADMYAQEFRVLETVNNIRLRRRGETEWKPLDPEQRRNVIDVLRGGAARSTTSKESSAKIEKRVAKSASVATIRAALRIDKRSLKKLDQSEDLYQLNLDNDTEREINTDWFYREIAHGVFTEQAWLGLTDSMRESVNRAILNHDPENEAHATKFRASAMKWWSLSPEAINRLVDVWKHRPNLDRRVNLSRRAIKNLLPWLRQGLSVSEARQRFAEDGDNGATPTQRARYALTASSMSKANRHFLKKHPDLLPPAPTLANPVVRKAIHEVRRHVITYLRTFGRKPDRIVIELTRKATQTEKVRNAILSRNRQREAERKAIIRDFQLEKLSPTQQKRAVERVMLCREQKCCPYSQLNEDTAVPITERMAAEGTLVEVDHIIPLSRSQDNGLNNKVLCFRDTNRNKGNRTPKEWLTTEQFNRLCQRFEWWRKERPRKWENLTRDAPDRKAWLESQLTDTAYAATQVGDYLRTALYDGESNGQRRVFFTKGCYTAILRKDWQLQDDGMPKQRTDHRHHAIDAAVVALSGPESLHRLAEEAEAQEKAKSESGNWPQRRPNDPPWGTIEEFRAQVMEQVKSLIVSHRPVKRKVSGYLHKEDLWGAVDEIEGTFRIRCPIAQLTPKMLREPVPESDESVRDRLFNLFKKQNYSDKDARKKAKEAFSQGRFKRRLVDPSLGKGGLVRDWNLRKIIRKCLQDNDINPDSFSTKQIEEFAKTGRLQMPSGVPIKTVVTIGPISDPVKIPVRNPFTGQQAINARTQRPLFRYHISRNNHHIEVLEDLKTGEWSDETVTMFQAAQRIRPAKNAMDGSRTTPRSAVDRADRNGKRFVFSLSEGETLHMRHPQTGQPAYFVVFKISPGRVFFIHHWDARPSGLQRNDSGEEIPDSKREEVSIAISLLKSLGVETNQPPRKVRIGLLGDVKPLIND